MRFQTLLSTMSISVALGLGACGDEPGTTMDAVSPTVSVPAETSVPPSAGGTTEGPGSTPVQATGTSAPSATSPTTTGTAAPPSSTAAPADTDTAATSEPVGTTPVPDPSGTGEPVGTPEPVGSEPVGTSEPVTPEPTVPPTPDTPEPETIPEPETPTEPAGPSVPQSDTCPDISWPSSNGSTNLGGGITVGGGEVFDGGMAVHEGSLENCAAGDQDSTDPLIEVADGGTVRNVIMGNNVGDGIHCLGSCTIENVWFPNVCDDAISALGGGTVTIRDSGFKNARDKTIQHNGTGTVNIDNVYIETAGKLYRSCGDGCEGSSRTANISNIVAIGVDQVAGVSTNDTVTLENICVHRTFSICSIYEPGSSDETTSGVNGSNEGPNDNCRFTADDTHALLDLVTGIPFTTESVCGGPNAYKSGSTATSCVDTFDRCLKACGPAGYGFKEIWCEGGSYAEGEGAICAMPTDSEVAGYLAESRVTTATNMVSKNDNCSTEWDIGIDESNNAQYCVCVKKPGYFEFDNWLSWDCQRRWW